MRPLRRSETTHGYDRRASIAAGKVMGAWVDLRAGDSFGTVVTSELDPSCAVFVPRGVANGFQALEDETSYVYLVNDHWRAHTGSGYTFVNAGDPGLAIPWPIPLEQATLSDKDRGHPLLGAVAPVLPRRIVVVGAGGQLAGSLNRLLRSRGLTNVAFLTRDDLDITDAAAVSSHPWERLSTVVNAAAWTDVDAAETPQGRLSAWQVNAHGVANLARAAIANTLTLVHVSSDYVFDGSRAVHDENEPASPLGVYGQSKAAGDTAASTVPRHYILRTSWVVGDGPNFVRTMARLARQGVRPRVVDDQVGRLTTADDLARAALHLLDARAPFGVYNVSSSGDPMSWADIAAEVFAELGRDPGDVTRVSTVDYRTAGPTAPRPRSSVLDLQRITATGFAPRDQRIALRDYLRSPQS